MLWNCPIKMKPPVQSQIFWSVTFLYFADSLDYKIHLKKKVLNYSHSFSVSKCKKFIWSVLEKGTHLPKDSERKGKSWALNLSWVLLNRVERESPGWLGWSLAQGHTAESKPECRGTGNKKTPQTSEGLRLDIHRPYRRGETNSGSLHRLCK